MPITLIAVSMLAGWCGTVPIVLPPLEIEFPKPRPICKVCLTVSAFAGLVLAAAVTQGFTTEASVLSVAVLGYIGGRVASDVYNGFFKK